MRNAKKENRRNVNINRLLFIGATATTIIFLLVVRLFYIQVVQHESYIKEANRQRQINIPINSGRGIIFDRNFIPLTERKEKKIAVILPQLFIQNQGNIEFLAKISNMKEEELIQKINSSKYPIEIPLEIKENSIDKRGLKTRGLFIVSKRLRYEDDALLSHVIGYINQVDNKGMSGLEKAYDSILMGSPTELLAATLDGRKQPLPGEGYSVVNSPMTQKNIRLTIDYFIQKIVEDIIDKYNRNGAIIISDINTGEILAMVSRPNYNPNIIAHHIQSEGDELYNKAIQMTFPPGSIFKLIVAADAMERGILSENEVFYCNGSETIDHVTIRCSAHNEGDNIELSFKEAFADSCNSVFIQIGKRLGAKSILEMAEKLGLNKKINIGLQEEEEGNLPTGHELLGPAIGNISIGQGEIEVTPLQINQLTQIIANEGVKNQLYLLNNILDDYKIVETFEGEKGDRVLSNKTANQLKNLMEAVMLEGTGKKVGEFADISAGKTGTAQASKRGRIVKHAWFTGYFPKNNPKYAVTVFIQEGGSGGAIAVPIFKDIIQGIIDLGYLN